MGKKTRGIMELPELNKIYNCDCLEFMKKLPDKCVDLVITSPPYNFDEGATLGTKYKADNIKDKMSQENYYEFQKEVITHLLRITSGPVFYNIQMLAGNKQALFLLIGYFYNKIKEVIIWDKKTAEPAMNNGCLNSQFEFILVFSDDSKRTFNNAYFERGCLSNTWYLSKNYSKISDSHSAIMPILLPEKVLINFTKEEDIIFDPFMGYGTTAVACEMLGRRWIGCEISPEYCKGAEERIERERNQLKLNL